MEARSDVVKEVKVGVRTVGIVVVVGTVALRQRV